MNIQIEKPIGAFRQVVAVQVGTGKFVYLSGLVAGDSTLGISGQANSIFEKIRFLLEQEGGALENLIKINAFIADMQDYQLYNETRNKIFENIQSLPASATIGGAVLVREGLKIEIDGVAFIPN